MVMDRLEYLGVIGRIMLKLILKNWWNCMECIFIWYRTVVSGIVLCEYVKDLTFLWRRLKIWRCVGWQNLSDATRNVVEHGYLNVN